MSSFLLFLLSNFLHNRGNSDNHSQYRLNNHNYDSSTDLQNNFSIDPPQIEIVEKICKQRFMIIFFSVNIISDNDYQYHL